MAEKKRKLNRKKKFLIIFISILMFLLFSVGGVALWQKDNIEAFMLSRKYSSEEILNKMSENDNTLKKEVEKYFSGKIREFTEEEKELIKSGKISEKQLIAKIISEENESLMYSGIKQEIVSTLSTTHSDGIEITFDESEILIPVPLKNLRKPAPTEEKTSLVVIGKPSQTDENSPVIKPAVSADAIISKYVSKLYVLESKYIGAIENVVSTAKAEAKAQGLTRKDTSKLLAIGAKYTSTINSLEAKCDGEVSAIISSLTRELKAINADTSIISTIRSAYANEKSLKRSYYMNMIGL